MTGVLRTVVLSGVVSLAATATAQAVTINVGTSQPAAGVALELDPDDFGASGGPGSGGSVIGDPTDVATKNERSPRPYGRFDPLGGRWVDSNDNPSVEWDLATDRPVRSMSFALTDAFDQGRSRELGDSSFSLTVGDATWSIERQEDNATLHWIEVLFDAPTAEATLLFETRLNDGWGVSQAKVAPVPLPPALLLLGSGFALMAALRVRHPARATG